MRRKSWTRNKPECIRKKLKMQNSFDKINDIFAVIFLKITFLKIF